MSGKSPPEKSSEERRTSERRVCRLNRLLFSQIRTGDSSLLQVYLYLVDLSEGGMRISLDRDLGEKETHFQIPLHALALTRRVNWR